MHEQLISLIQFPFFWQIITYFENWSHQEVLLHRQKSVKRHKVSNSNEQVDNSFNNTNEAEIDENSSNKQLSKDTIYNQQMNGPAASKHFKPVKDR